MYFFGTDDKCDYFSVSGGGFQFYRRYKETKQLEMIYKTDTSIIVSDYIQDGNLLLAFPTDKGCQAVLVDRNNKETILFESESSRYIEIIMYNSSKMILLNCESQPKTETSTYEKVQLIEIDLKTYEQIILFELNSVYDENRLTYKGSIIGNVGGIDDNGFVYSVEMMNDEGFGDDNDGESNTSIWYYDLNSHQSEKLFDYGYHVDVILGNKEAIFIKDYRVVNHSVKTNKIVLLENDVYVMYTLDDESSFFKNRLSASYKDHLFYYVGDENIVYVYDFASKTYQQYSFLSSYNYLMIDTHIYTTSMKDDQLLLSEYVFE